MKVGATLAIAFALAACGEKSASQKELEYLQTRVDMTEGEIADIQKTIKYTIEIKDWEARRQKEEDQRAADLARLRQGEKQVEGAQQMLCDATGDC